MTFQTASWPRILAEIAKCDLLCANCHRVLHWQRRNQEEVMPHPAI